MQSSSLTVMFFTIGNLVGSGFFLMPTTLAPLGVAAIYSWCLAISMALLCVFVMLRLSNIFPEASVLSDFFYTNCIKSTVAMLYWGVIIACNAAYIFTLAECLGCIYRSMFIVLLLTLVNHFSKRSSVVVLEYFLTGLKFSILLIMPIVLYYLHPSDFALKYTNPSEQHIVKTGILCFWTFLGMETALIFGKGSSMKRGMIMGVILVSILYVTTSLILISSNTPNLTFGNFASRYITNGNSIINNLMAFVLIASLYGWIASTGQMALVYANTNLFGKAFAKTTPSNNSALGLWVSTALALLIVGGVNSLNLGNQFEIILDICVYVQILIYTICTVALIRISSSLLDVSVGLLALTMLSNAMFLNIKMFVISIAITFLLLLMNRRKEDCKTLVTPRKKLKT